MQVAFKIIGVAIVALVLVLLIMRTWAHQMVWLNDETLWSHVVGHNPEARGAHRAYGNSLHRQGRYEEALAVYLVAIERRPDYDKAYINLGATLIQLKRYEEAEHYLRKGFAINPNVEFYHINLGQALYGQKRLKEAAAALRLIGKQNPEHWAAQDILRAIQQQQAEQRKQGP